MGSLILLYEELNIANQKLKRVRRILFITRVVAIIIITSLLLFGCEKPQSKPAPQLEKEKTLTLFEYIKNKELSKQLKHF